MIVLGDDDDDDDDDDDEDDTTTSWCVDVDVEDKGFTIADEANEHNASHVVSNRAAAAASSSCSSDSTAICLFIVVVVVVVASFSCSALLERMLSVTFSLPVLGLLGLGEESLLSLDFKCDNILCGIDYYAVVTTFCVDV